MKRILCFIICSAILSLTFVGCSEKNVSVDLASPEVIEVGDYIKFGTYEQDNNTSNGKEAVEWRVLEIEGDKALIISKYVLDFQLYDVNYRDNSYGFTWETSTMREWLNKEFLNSCFSSAEKIAICTTELHAEEYSDFYEYAGNDTQDKVFLLSVTEAKRYFSSNEDRQCTLTEYAKSKGIDFDSESGVCAWWLRTPGSQNLEFANIAFDGRFSHGLVEWPYGVRPAIWINLEKYGEK